MFGFIQILEFSHIMYITQSIYCVTSKKLNNSIFATVLDPLTLYLHLDEDQRLLDYPC